MQSIKIQKPNKIYNKLYIVVVFSLRKAAIQKWYSGND